MRLEVAGKIPEAAERDFAPDHVGFATSKIDEEHAQGGFRFLSESGELSELDPQRG